MGNWHCVPDGCSEVVYQEYLSEKIRWRYGTEPWQEIIGTGGLTYTTKVSNNLAGTGPFMAITQIAVRWDGSFVGWQAPVTSLCLFPYTSIDDFCLIAPILSPNCLPNNEWGIWMLPSNQRRDYGCNIKIWANGTTYLHGLGPAQGHKLIDFISCNPAKRNTKCEFKIFNKNGVQLRTETRATCPEVEKIACSLNPQAKKIEIKKLPYIEKIEVVPYQYSAYRLPGVPAPIVQADPIPPECLNIYNNSIYVVPPSGQGIYPNATPFDSLVAQICSYPGCPPPVYDVLCNSCGCESCPGDSCPVECNGVICCYNDYGVSIKEISLADYCGGQP